MIRPASRLLLRLALVAIGLVAVGAALALALRGRGASPEPRGPRIPRGIVLFCIDTLRRDSLRPPDEADPPMPALQRFARDATTFADASATCTWTSPSVTSLLTGLLPSHHGVLTFGRTAPLIAAVTTLAEVLKDAGWWTYASTAGGWVSPERGLAQGFDHFDVTFDEQGPDAVLSAWNRARPRDRPFFLFLHTYAAHDPYGHRAWKQHGPSAVHAAATLEPADFLAGLERGGGHVPPDLLTPFALQNLSNPPGRSACMQAIGMPRYLALWGESIEWLDGGYANGGDRASIEKALHRSYRAGLAGADDMFADTLTALERYGALEQVDVLFVGDHGEAFGEHRTLGHGLTLYDELLRVPLIVRAPERLPAGRIVHGSCSLLDVTPTILDLAMLAPPAGLDGRSLGGLARGEEAPRPVVGELDRAASPKNPTGPRYRYVAVRTATAKWLLWFDPSDGRTIREELYDLGADPSESKPLPASAVLPARFGDEFCRAVGEQRNHVRRVAGLPTVDVSSSCAGPR